MVAAASTLTVIDRRQADQELRMMASSREAGVDAWPWVHYYQYWLFIGLDYY